MFLIERLHQQLEGGGLSSMSRQLGLDEQQVSQVATGALPVLLSALSRNSADPEGSTALFGALERDHDGSALEDVSGFLASGSAQADGAGILRHVLGPRQPAVESGLSRLSGVDSRSVGQILAMLAPLVMGALGKVQRQRTLDARGVAEVLGSERQTIERASPQAAGILGTLLDADGDGQIGDDLARMGAGLLSSFLGRKR